MSERGSCLNSLSSSSDTSACPTKFGPASVSSLCILYTRNNGQNANMYVYFAITLAHYEDPVRMLEVTTPSQNSLESHHISNSLMSSRSNLWVEKQKWESVFKNSDETEEKKDFRRKLEAVRDKDLCSTSSVITFLTHSGSARLLQTLTRLHASLTFSVVPVAAVELCWTNSGGYHDVQIENVAQVWLRNLLSETLLSRGSLNYSDTKWLRLLPSPFESTSSSFSFRWPVGGGSRCSWERCDRLRTTGDTQDTWQKSEALPLGSELAFACQQNLDGCEYCRNEGFSLRGLCVDVLEKKVELRMRHW